MTCPREGRWIGGCRFEPRYDYAPISPDEREWITANFLAAFDRLNGMRNMRTKVYVRDVCIRCGKTIERSER